MEKVKKIVSNFRQIIKTKTVSQSVLTSVFTVTNGFLGVAFYILAARFLGPETFGTLTVSLVTLTLISDIATVGTDTGIVKFVGQHYTSDRNRALKFLKLGLKVKFFIGIIVLIIGFFLAPFFTSVILSKPELVIPIRFAIFGSFISLLFTFATSSLQAVQKFWIWGFINIFSNASRLAILIALLITATISVNLLLSTYIVCLFLGFFLALAFLPNFFEIKNENELAKDFFHYNRWVALFVLIAAVAGRLDTFITTKLLSLKDVGIYGVATGLAVIGSQIVSGITTAVAPKLAGMDTKKKAIDYLKKLQYLVLGLGILAIIIGIPTGYILVPLLYGKEYISSVFPLAILIVAQAIFLVSIPAHSATIYYFSYPKLFVYTSIVHLIIISVVGYLMIINFGYIGAALAVLIGNISNLVIPGVWVLNKFKSK